MKGTMKTIAVILALALTLAVLGACSAAPKTTAAAPEASAVPAAEPSAAPADKSVTVGVSLATATNNPHVAALAKALVAAIEAQGWKCELQDADNDSAKQSTQFDNLVTMGVDLIVYWANDAEAAVADCKKAADAGIPVISYFIDTAEEAHQYIEAYVGADQLVIANEVGKMADSLLGGSGQVAIINGKEGKTDFVQRSQGFRDTLASLGSYDVVAEEYCDSDRTQCQTIMENYLTTYPDLDLVFTCSDDFGYGALTAIEAAGKAGQIKIVSIDGQPEVLQAIADGKWDSTIYQTPAMMGDKVVEVAKKILAGEQITEYSQATDYYVITKDNVNDYLGAA